MDWTDKRNFFLALADQNQWAGETNGGGRLQLNARTRGKNSITLGFLNLVLNKSLFRIQSQICLPLALPKENLLPNKPIFSMGRKLQEISLSDLKPILFKYFAIESKKRVFGHPIW